MIFYFALAGVLLLTILLAVKLKERSLYVLFWAAYTQNFVVPFLLTKGFINVDVARALVLLKDFLLVELFAWCLVVLLTRFRSHWPRPLIPLCLLTAYCSLRIVVALLVFDDVWSSGLHRFKEIWFPLEIVVVVMVSTASNPDFGKRFLRHITYALSVLAVVALAILVWAPPDFWIDNANIAQLQADVKGDLENDLSFDTGLPLAGTMQGRDTFTFLSFFRAVGTFGEALALSFSMAVPVLLLSLHYPKSLISMIAFAAAATALIFGLTRSAWMFCVLVGVYVMIRRKKYFTLVLVGCVIIGFILLWAPMREFVTLTMSNISPDASNPDSAHAEGILWFYSRGFSDPGNLLGKGMTPEAQTIGESGYAYLLEHFGAVAYLSFIWLCFSLYGQLRTTNRQDGLSFIAQGIPLGMLVIMHFSQYPFSLPTFMSLWYIVGLCLGDCLLLKRESVLTGVPTVDPILRVQPA